MAVKTPIPEAAIRDILCQYHLGDMVDCRPIAQGAVQTNYRITTHRASVVLRCYENRTPESVRFEIELLRLLADRGFPCAALVPNRQGGYDGLYCGKPYVLFEFMEGKHLVNSTEEQKCQLVEQVACLHDLTENFRPAYTEHRLNYDVPTCEKLVRELAAGIATDNALNKLDWYRCQLDRLDLDRRLRMGVCHCDFHFTNILFLDGRFHALLDFDDANYTYLLFDVASLLEPFKASFDWDTWDRFAPEDEVFDFENARRVLAEYQKHRPLNEAEKRHLFDVYKLSILVDCLWYFERGDVRDFYEKRKLEYLDRLGRERFQQALFE